MTANSPRTDSRRADVWRALDTVIDPELDEPVTDLDFVASLAVSDDGDVAVHLRLPTSFCAPNFAYLMASDAKTALSELDWTRSVSVALDDHHDSAIINAGLATDAGYRGTFGHEAEDDLEELRTIFRRKAHVAAMERSLTALMAAHPWRSPQEMATVVLGDLPPGRTTDELLDRRSAIGLSTRPDAPVMVDHLGAGYVGLDVQLALRRARSTRISIEGNAHFCRGLLRTRYDDPDRTTISA